MARKQYERYDLGSDESYTPDAEAVKVRDRLGITREYIYSRLLEIVENRDLTAPQRQAETRAVIELARLVGFEPPREIYLSPWRNVRVLIDGVDPEQQVGEEGAG